MTSVMQRPRSTQPNERYEDDGRPMPSSHGHGHSHSTGFSPAPPPLGTSELGDQLADLQRELLGQTSMAGAPSAAAASSSQLAGSSGLMGFGVGSNERGRGVGRGEGGVAGQTGEREGGYGGLGGMADGANSNIGLLDDPAVLAIVGQTSHLDSDYELNLATQALTSQLAAEELPGPLSDLDLTSAGTFHFPELPASLLDQAPEYEYSVHTQANVFDAVQDYDPAGEEEAARIFSLDHYDPALLDVSGNPSMGPSGAGEEFWNYNEASTGGSLQQHPMSDYANFHDSSSLSDYPEPSTAPTSRASEWKQDPMAGDVYPSSQTSFTTPADYPLKRRRESFDASLNQQGQSNVYMSGYGPGMDQQGHFYPSQGYVDHRQQFMMRPDARKTAVVPSQAGGNGRGRMTSWGGEGQYGSDEWPPPPAPAPMGNNSNAMGNFGHHRPSGQAVYPHEMNLNAAFAPPPSLPAGSNMVHNAMAARSSSSDASGPSTTTGHDGRGSPNSAARNASQNEMINALGNAMDASMESDGVAKCPYPNCTKTFAKNRSYNLKAHLRSHSQLKPFACSHCPRAFSRKHDLERHARVHSGDKPYLCEACGKGFPRSDALRRHWRVEKECGEKAVEIEAGQPLPSLPPGVNTVAAQAKAPGPGMMQLNGPTTTAISSSGPSVPSHPMMMGSFSSFPSHPGWDNHNFGPNNSGYGYQQPERKRTREDY